MSNDEGNEVNENEGTKIQSKVDRSMVSNVRSSASEILNIAMDRYRCDLSALSDDEVRVVAGKWCFEITQNLMQLLCILEDNFGRAFDINTREGDGYYKVNSISIFELLDHIEKYESLSRLYGVTEEQAMELVNEKLSPH